MASSRPMARCLRRSWPGGRPARPRCGGCRPAAGGWLAVGEQLGTLGEDDAVDVDDLPAQGGHGLQGGGEHFGRIAAAVLGVGVGEHLADVAQGGGAEQGVDHGVQQGVAVAVADRLAVVGNVDAAERSGPPGWSRCKSYPIPTRMASVARSPSALRPSVHIGIGGKREDYTLPGPETERGISTRKNGSSDRYWVCSCHPCCTRVEMSPLSHRYALACAFGLAFAGEKCGLFVREPKPGRRVGLQKAEQQPGHLLPAARAGVGGRRRRWWRRRRVRKC